MKEVKKVVAIVVAIIEVMAIVAIDFVVSKSIPWYSEYLREVQSSAPKTMSYMLALIMASIVLYSIIRDHSLMILNFVIQITMEVLLFVLPLIAVFIGALIGEDGCQNLFNISFVGGILGGFAAPTFMILIESLLLQINRFLLKKTGITPVIFKKKLAAVAEDTAA